MPKFHASAGVEPLTWLAYGLPVWKKMIAPRRMWEAPGCEVAEVLRGFCRGSNEGEVIRGKVESSYPISVLCILRSGRHWWLCAHHLQVNKTAGQSGAHSRGALAFACFRSIYHTLIQGHCSRVPRRAGLTCRGHCLQSLGSGACGRTTFSKPQTLAVCEASGLLHLSRTMGAVVRLCGSRDCTRALKLVVTGGGKRKPCGKPDCTLKVLPVLMRQKNIECVHGRACCAAVASTC